MLKNSQIDTEGAAVVGLIAIAIIAIFYLGAGAKEIAIAISSGLVGFLRGKSAT